MIQLGSLSSGEKQVVAIFAHIMFYRRRENLFVIVDEPELSISVEWQEKILVDILKCRPCTGLFAVTHSPFIFDNELRSDAHSIAEFSERDPDIVESYKEIR